MLAGAAGLGQDPGPGWEFPWASSGLWAPRRLFPPREPDGRRFKEEKDDWSLWRPRLMSQCQPQARRRFSWPFQSLLQEPTPVTAGAARRPGPSSLCVLCGRPGRSLDALPAVGAWWAQRWAQSRSSCPGFAWLRNSSSRRPASVRAAGVRCGRPLAGARVRAPSRPCSLHGTARQAQHASASQGPRL